MTATIPVVTTTDSDPAARPLAAALAALRAGRPVLMVDRSHGDGIGAAFLAAALAGPTWAAWLVRNTTGLLVAPLPAERARALDLPPAVRGRADPPTGSVQAVSVDAAGGIGTGISARDRARTARVLADPDSRPRDLHRPGHLVPVLTRPGGVLDRPGLAETAVDLCRLAGLPLAGLAAELISDDGRLLGPDATAALGRRADLPVVDPVELRRHRLVHGDGARPRLSGGDVRSVATRHGDVDARGYVDELTGARHLVVLGPQRTTGPPGPVAVHLECTADDVIGSCATCDRELDDALRTVTTVGGLLIILRRPTHHRVPGDVEEGAVAAILDDLAGPRRHGVGPGSFDRADPW